MTQTWKHRSAAAAASVSGHGATPASDASSPASATTAIRRAMRLTCPSAPAGHKSRKKSSSRVRSAARKPVSSYATLAANHRRKARNGAP